MPFSKVPSNASLWDSVVQYATNFGRPIAGMARDLWALIKAHPKQSIVYGLAVLAFIASSIYLAPFFALLKTTLPYHIGLILAPLLSYLCNIISLCATIFVANRVANFISAPSVIKHSATNPQRVVFKDKLPITENSLKPQLPEPLKKPPAAIPGSLPQPLEPSKGQQRTLPPQKADAFFDFNMLIFLNLLQQREQLKQSASADMPAPDVFDPSRIEEYQRSIN